MDKNLFIQLVFYSFAGILLFSALKVISARNTVHSALYLVLAFFTCAAIWILLRAEFLAIALILVYVGAVMVLFLFVVMMLNINHQPLREGFIKYLPLGLIVALTAVAEMVIVLQQGFGHITEAKTGSEFMISSNTKALGSILYTEYLYQFEIAAVVLLLAIIAAIVLTLHHQKGTKHQNPANQVQVKRDDRIRIVKVQAEKPE